MTDLFHTAPTPPLAEALRPASLDAVVGQQHLIGPGKPLRLAAHLARLHAGAKVEVGPCIMHGKQSEIVHDGTGLFSGLPNPMRVGRYHSLVVEPDSLPACFDVTAWSETREIMGIRHRQWDLEGVQFHPESILSEQGHQLLANFLHR